MLASEPPQVAGPVKPDGEKLVCASEDLHGLEAEWRALFAASASDNPFLSWEWNAVWVGEYGAGDAPQCLSVRRAGQLLALMPFALENRRAGFLADPLFADYAGILALPDQDEAVQALVRHVCALKGWRKAVFEPVRSISPMVQGFENGFEQSGVLWRREIICGNPWLATIGRYEDFMAGKAKKRRRQEIRTTINHLQNGGGWRFIESRTGPEALRIYEALIRFHLHRQQGKPGTSIFSDAQNIAFFRRLIERPVSGFAVHLSAVEFAGDLVSAAYSISCGKTLYYWIPSFDTRIRSVSLGKLHIHCLLQSAFAGDVERFDFMGGDEAYKYQWSKESYDIYRYVLYKSRVPFALDSVRLKLRNWLKARKNSSSALQALWRVVSKFIT